MAAPLKVKGHTKGQGPIFPGSRGIMIKKGRQHWKNNKMDRSSGIILKKLDREEVKWCCAQVKGFFSGGRLRSRTAGTGSSPGRSWDGLL